MPKSTDTREKTREIAAQLAAAGEEISARKVRSILGTGSLSTISDELEKIDQVTPVVPKQALPTLQPLMPASTPVADPALSLEMGKMTQAVANLASECGNLRAEMAAQRAHAEAQLKTAYERFEAVQRQALLQIDAARAEGSELREKLRNASLDAQLREDAMKGKANQLRDENQRLRGRIEELTRRNEELVRQLKQPARPEEAQATRTEPQQSVRAMAFAGTEARYTE